MRDRHADVSAALGAFALDACPAGEAAAIEAHLGTCPTCAAEAERLRRAASLLGTSEPVAAATTRRDSMLAAARARRPPAAGRSPSSLGPYASAVMSLDMLLRDLTADDWQAGSVADWSVEELVEHLAASDGELAGQLVTAGSVATSGAGGGARPAHAAWRATADHILRDATSGGIAGLDRQVRLNGPGGDRLPVRDALVQRTFETWIHADDIRVALGRPAEPPKAGDALTIAGLGIRLLPAALDRAGRAHPGRTVRLVLTNPEREWTVPASQALSGGVPVASGGGPPDATVTIDTIEFGYLMGGRRDPATVPCIIDGDRQLGLDLLTAAATLGCGY